MFMLKIWCYQLCDVSHFVNVFETGNNARARESVSTSRDDGLIVGCCVMVVGTVGDNLKHWDVTPKFDPMKYN